MHKKKILLCWAYSRFNWIENFENLNDQFEFIYLFYLEKKQETEVLTQNKIIYYTDYKTPRSLLESIRPHKVIFMGLDGLITVALNIQCKKLGILTYYMAHGAATLSHEDYTTVAYEKRNLLKDSFSRKFRLWLYNLRFICAALGIKYIHHLPILLKFQIDKTKMHPIFAMQKNKTFLRVPSGYILFANEARNFFVEQDDVDYSMMHVIGNMEINSFLNLKPEYDTTLGNYVLYLETPLSDIENNEFSTNLLSREGYNHLLQAMANYAKSLNLKLVVKLHPYSYVNTFLLKDENIVYIKDTNKEKLIMNSSGIIFYNSSLAVPALYYKTGLMFTIGKLDDFQQKIAKCDCCYVYDHETFIDRPQMIKFLKEHIVFDKSKFMDTYIGEGIDGNGLKRLANIFNA